MRRKRCAHEDGGCRGDPQQSGGRSGGVHQGLRAEFIEAGKGPSFEALKIFLTGERAPMSYADLATSLGTTEAALKMAVSRLRQRYAELLRQEIANTVSSPDEVEDELRALMSALS